jgi:hypothetical protein
MNDSLSWFYPVEGRGQRPAGTCHDYRPEPPTNSIVNEQTACAVTAALSAFRQGEDTPRARQEQRFGLVACGFVAPVALQFPSRLQAGSPLGAVFYGW